MLELGLMPLVTTMPSVGCADYTRLRHPASPLLHQLFPLRPLDNFYDLLYLYLLCRSYDEKRPEIQEFQYLLLFFDAGLGTTLWGEMAL